jgi:hypothetical protein
MVWAGRCDLEEGNREREYPGRREIADTACGRTPHRFSLGTIITR